MRKLAPILTVFASSLLLLANPVAAFESPDQITNEFTPSERTEHLQTLIDKAKNDLSPWDLRNIRNAQKAYREGRKNEGDESLADFLVDHEPLLTDGEDNRPLNRTERAMLVEMMASKSPEALTKVASRIVHGLRMELHEATSNNVLRRGFADAVIGMLPKPLQVRASEEEVAQASNKIDHQLEIMAKMFALDAKDSASAKEKAIRHAAEFIKNPNPFNLVMGDALQAVALGYPSLSLHHERLVGALFRFQRTYSFHTPLTSDRDREVELIKEIEAKEGHARNLQIYLNRDIAVDASARTLGTLMVAGGFLSAITTGGAAMPLSASLIAGGQVLAGGVLAATSAVSLGDRAYLSGPKALLSTESALDWALVLSGPASRIFGAGAKTLSGSKWVRGLTISSTMIQRLETVRKWSVRSILSASAGYGAYQVSFADSIAKKTGQTPYEIRVRGAVFLSLGLLGGWKELRQIRTELKAGHAAMKAEGGFMAGNPVVDWFRTLNGCIGSKTKEEQKKLFKTIFLRDLGQNVVLRVLAVKAGTLHTSEIPVETGAFVMSQMFSYAKTKIVAGPQEKFFTTWMRVSILSSGRAVSDASIYMVMPEEYRPRYGKKEDHDAILKRLSYNMSWAWGSTLASVNFDQFLAGLECMYPLGNTGKAMYGALRYGYNQGWGLVYFAGRNATMSSDGPTQ
jgi:hypothetical protein